jgi:hypothetical protein
VTARLERTTFSVSRAADFLDVRALESQTGQPRDRFGDVVVKELLDNALDACETVGVAPEITLAVAADGGPQLVTVEDNGDGIPAEVVGCILDYTTLTSDKALYRSPCRGAQGNALKTIIGIPPALGVREPVIIEAQGVRHEITVGLDLAGNVKVGHEQEASPRTEGTRVAVPLPTWLDFRADRWVRGYALVNPHATFTVDRGAEASEIYKATADLGFRKPLPTDPTSPHWYDDAAFARLIGGLAARGDDRPLGEFIREFRGLSSTAKARRIAAGFPWADRISGIEEHPDKAGLLLSSMQWESAEPSPAVLGQVPKVHYEDLLDDIHGVDRFWYAHRGTVHNGIAWHIEVAVADTLNRGSVIFATNYGVTFGDPLGGTELESAEVWAEGVRSFLAECDAAPDASNGHYRAAVVHVTCAAPTFLDKGKVKLDVPAEVAEVFAKALWAAGRELYREAQAESRAEDREERRAEAAARRERDAAERADRMTAAAERRRLREERQAARAQRITVREAVFAVIEAAIVLQRGGTDLPFSVHDLFYKIRPLALKLLPPGTKVTSKYVEQVIIPEWERKRGAITGMYREPRGTLHEPHTGREVRLGTREVRAYVPPEWTYNKILVAEKAGLWPVLQAAKLAERHDMAIITSEGFTTTAARELLAAVQEVVTGTPAGDVEVYSLHDADLAGYNIGRTLGEGTARMPDHNVRVHDLGLTVDAAIERGLESEEFIRDKAIATTVLPLLSPTAHEWFTGRVIERDNHGKAKKWLGRRVELNAFTSPELIAFIEDGLEAAGAAGKVIPPPKVLRAHYREARDDHATTLANQMASAMINVAAIELTARRIVRRRSRVLIKRAAVEAKFGTAPERSWREVSQEAARERVEGCDVDFARLVHWLIMQPLAPRKGGA